MTPIHMEGSQVKARNCTTLAAFVGAGSSWFAFNCYKYQLLILITLS